MKLNDLAKLVLSIIICELAGVFGALFTAQAIPAWYAGLVKPALSPPNWVFGPVWTTLYVLMGVAFYLIWKEGAKKRDVRLAMYAFGFQLFLNAIWTPIFFGLRSPFYGLIVVVMMFLAIIWTIALFHNLQKKAAYLLLPYLAWVGFATYLNFEILRLNF